MAEIVKNYHAIEKALALRAPRLGFGLYNAEQLLGRLEVYCPRYGVDSTARIGLRCLEEYLKFNSAESEIVAKVKPGFEQLVADMRCPALESAPGGAVQLLRADVWRAARRGLDEFFSSRHSVRHFGSDPVARKEIEHALRLAQTAPSVCNRQGWRVHVFEGDRKLEVLKLQNGNRGFGPDAAWLLLVTADLRSFVGVGERNQPWIDGGMYSMALVYALHSLGLGTCCLNTSNDLPQDLALRAQAGIPEFECIVMMIAVGSLPETFKVAHSSRFAIDEVVVWHLGDGSTEGPRSSGVHVNG